MLRTREVLPEMITYNGAPVMGRHVALHAVTLEDSNPYEVIYHVRRWMNMIDDKREIDIQNITRMTAVSTQRFGIPRWRDEID